MNHIGKTFFGRLLIVLLIAFNATQSTHAQDAARIQLSTDNITAGDQVKAFIEVTCPPNTRLTWATIADTFNSLEVVEKGKIDTINGSNGITYKQRLIITGFDSGVFTVPAFQFSFIPPAPDSPYISATKPQFLTVSSVPVDTTKPFKPIKSIIYVNLSWLDYLAYIIAGILLLAACVIAIIYFIRKNKNPAPPPPPAKVETPQEKALRLLAALENKELWQKGNIKEYYIELSDIVRTYIEQRFHTPAMELTTDELLYKARFHKELQPHHDALAAILQTADLAKFAKWQPLPQEHFAAMDNAKQFIKNSNPAPSPSPINPSPVNPPAEP